MITTYNPSEAFSTTKMQIPEKWVESKFPIGQKTYYLVVKSMKAKPECHICDMKFDSVKELEKHLKEEHQKAETEP